MGDVRSPDEPRPATTTVVAIAHADTVRIAPRPVPQALFQLLDDIPDFVGREALLAELQAHFEAADTAAHGAGARIALWGPPGVGKSALALHLAHRMADRFPDAQLYVDLGAGAGAPVAPAEALAGFLRALGLEGPFHERVEERAAFYRARLAHLRALVVLDNAGDISQVRPLLPGSGTCGVVVTSRAPLGVLEGALSRRVDVLAPEAALRLLAEIAGPARVDAEPDRAREIVRLCGELPLAIRIAGGRLANSPDRSLAWMADRLADARTRLSELELSDQAVRASFIVSYRELARRQAKLFAQLAAIPGPTFSVTAAASATTLSEPEAQRLLDELAQAQMLGTIGENRYRFHDLMRLLADELLDRQPSAMRTTVRARAVRWLQQGAATAHAELAADGPGRASALAWFEVERQSLVAAIELSYAAQQWATVIQLAFLVSGFFALRAHWDDWMSTHELAVQSACNAGDRRGEAIARCQLAHVYSDASRWEDAAANYLQALTIFRDLDDASGVGRALGDLANVYSSQGRQDEALTSYEQALTIFRELGDRQNTGEALNNIGTFFRLQGRWVEAASSCEEALEIYREIKHRGGEASALDNLANVYYDQGRSQEALALNERALEMFRDLHDRHAEVIAIGNRAVLYLNLGRTEDAIAGHEQALSIYRELHDRRGEGRTLGNLANVDRSRRRWQAAIDKYEAALAIFRQLGDPHDEVLALHNLGSAYRHQRRWREAISYHKQALALFRALGARREEARVLASLGRTELRSGRLLSGGRHLRAALALHGALHDADAE
jgi:tetratricopeptide (TPR) repeat protein